MLQKRKAAVEDTLMNDDFAARVHADPAVFGGLPCVRNTRIPIAVIRDGIAEGLTGDCILYSTSVVGWGHAPR
jgi:uncharacterized protein (DUF433 family)